VERVIYVKSEEKSNLRLHVVLFISSQNSPYVLKELFSVAVPKLVYSIFSDDLSSVAI
jgi:hypothetical protein